jgi:hypothetical protein
MLRWLGFVEEQAERGKVYQRGHRECHALGIADHPELLSRLEASVHRAQVASDLVLDAKHVLLTMRAMPPLHRPVRRRRDVVVFFRIGKPFVITERNVKMRGGARLVHSVGQEGAYAYYRSPTPEELESLERMEREEQLRAAEMARVLGEIHAIRGIVRAGECPAGMHSPQGDELCHPVVEVPEEDELEFWFVVGASHIWCCEITTRSSANMYDGAFPATGFRVPHDVQLERRLRAVLT